MSPPQPLILSHSSTNYMPNFATSPSLAPCKYKYTSFRLWPLSFPKHRDQNAKAGKHLLDRRRALAGEMDGEKKVAVAAEVEKKEEAAVVVDVGLKELSKKLDDFAKERDWEKYHQPRNLLLAMIAEVGELSEVFMWKGEVARGLSGWEEPEKEHLGEELSDVLLYLIRLSDMCGVDLGDAAIRKIAKNAVKYPAPSKSESA